MNIYIKLATRNLMRKKLRFLLLFLTFILSALAMMTAVFIRDAALLSRENKLRDDTLNSQLLIRSASSESPFFRQDDIAGLLNNIYGIKNITPRIGIGAAIKDMADEEIALIGIDYDLQTEVYEFRMTDSAGIEPFEGKAIVCKNFAEKHNYKLGDFIRLSVKDREVNFKIAGIAENKGIFENDRMVIVPLKEVQKLINKEGNITSLGITIKNLEDIAGIKGDLERAVGSKYIVEQKYDMDYYRSYVGTISMAVSIFAVFAVFITLFITYSTFKTMIYERITQIGILRSLGMTKSEIFFSIYTENFIIVLISSAVGILSSIQFIRYILSFIAQGEVLLDLDILKITYIFLGLLSVGLLSIFTSVIKVLELPVVDIIKGNINKYSIYDNYLRWFVGFALLALSIYFVVNSENFRNGLDVLILGIACLVLAFILLAELLHKLFSRTLFKIFNIFGFEARLVLRDFNRDYKKSAESLVLIMIVIGIAYLSFITSFVVKESVNKIFAGTDIYLKGINSASAIDERLMGIQGIDSVISQLRINKRMYGVDVQISGIDPDKYSGISFETFKQGSKKQAFEELKKGKNIIVTTTFIKNTNKEIGDLVGIKVGDKYTNYKIVGISSSFENMGKVLFISKENFYEDIGYNNYILYLIKLKTGYDAKNVVESISGNLEEKEYTDLNTTEEIFKENDKQNRKLFRIIDVLLMVSAIVGIICLNNNLIINMLAKIRIFGIERTIGMSKVQFSKTILFEGLFLCIEGGLLGLILGYMMNIYLAKILSFYIGDLNIAVNLWIMAGLLVVSAIIGILSGLYPLNKVGRIDIIKSIKGFE